MKLMPSLDLVIAIATALKDWDGTPDQAASKLEEAIVVIRQYKIDNGWPVEIYESAESAPAARDEGWSMASIHRELSEAAERSRPVTLSAAEARTVLDTLAAERREERWYPDIDPITGAPHFMDIEHPTRGMVPTYGGPFDSFTLSERDIDDSTPDTIYFTRERFDHDEGCWVDCIEQLGIVAITQNRLLELEEARDTLAARPQPAPAEQGEELAALLITLDDAVGDLEADGNPEYAEAIKQARHILTVLTQPKEPQAEASREAQTRKTLETAVTKEISNDN